MQTHQQIAQRLLSILGLAPKLREILLSDDDIEEKRSRIKTWLSDVLAETYEINPKIPPLRYILVRDAIDVFRKIVSLRSETLAGFSLLKYINHLLIHESGDIMEKPSAAFFAELEHLLKGITDQSGIYDGKAPAVQKSHGVKAARKRSAELSRMAVAAEKHMQTYPSGLEQSIINRRIRNKYRILKYFKATEAEWDKWQWHLHNIIQNADELAALVHLSDQEYEAVRLARRNRIPFGITPYYVSLIDHDSSAGRDRAVRAQVIPSLHYVRAMTEARNRQDVSMDFMLERDTSPIEGITRRYPNIVILKPVLTCPQICVYCQRNWEISDVYAPRAVLPGDKLDAAI